MFYLVAMSSKYKFYNPDGIYFVSFATVLWIDIFTRELYRELIIESWKYCQKEKGLMIYGWVLMTNHAHLIISKNGNDLLENIMRDMKKFLSHKIIEAVRGNIQESRREWILELFARAGKNNSNNRKYQFWQQDNHPIELTSNEIKDQKLYYIHRNPVEAGFVDEPEHWRYSSARNYAGEKGMIDVEFM